MAVALAATRSTTREWRHNVNGRTAKKVRRTARQLVVASRRDAILALARHKWWVRPLSWCFNVGYKHLRLPLDRERFRRFLSASGVRWPEEAEVARYIAGKTGRKG